MPLLFKEASGRSVGEGGRRGSPVPAWGPESFPHGTRINTVPAAKATAAPCCTWLCLSPTPDLGCRVWAPSCSGPHTQTLQSCASDVTPAALRSPPLCSAKGCSFGRGPGVVWGAWRWGPSPRATATEDPLGAGRHLILCVRIVRPPAGGGPGHPPGVCETRQSEARQAGEASAVHSHRAPGTL